MMLGDTRDDISKASSRPRPSPYIYLFIALIYPPSLRTTPRNAVTHCSLWSWGYLPPCPTCSRAVQCRHIPGIVAQIVSAIGGGHLINCPHVSHPIPAQWGSSNSRAINCAAHSLSARYEEARQAPAGCWLAIKLALCQRCHRLPNYYHCHSLERLLQKWTVSSPSKDCSWKAGVSQSSRSLERGSSVDVSSEPLQVTWRLGRNVGIMNSAWVLKIADPNCASFWVCCQKKGVWVVSYHPVLATLPCARNFRSKVAERDPNPT